MTESLSQGEDIRLSKILIFAGTIEGRKLSEHLCERGIEHTVCVATEYGEIVLQENPFAHVHMGRMDSEGMRSFFAEQKCKLIVDATHPYAAIVTENIKQAVYAFNETHAVTDNQADSSISENIEYVRLKRDTDISADYDNIRYFEDNEACAKALNNTYGNILLTTGSKDLSVYCKTSDVRERLYVRVLPGLESISLCMHNDITGKHILALQGPFSTQLNEALIDQYDIRCLVTKKSGAAGGFIEKIAAAKNKNIPVYIVGQSVQDDGMSFEAVCEYIDSKYNKLHIMLAGNESFHKVPDLIVCHRSFYNVIIMFNSSSAVCHKIKPLICHLIKGQYLQFCVWRIFIMIYYRCTFSCHCPPLCLFFKTGTVKSISEILVKTILKNTRNRYFYITSMIHNILFHLRPPIIPCFLPDFLHLSLLQNLLYPFQSHMLES